MAGKCWLLTGPPGVGKTTLVIKVLETLQNSNPNFKIQGFYTGTLPFLTSYISTLTKEGSQRVGFDVFTLDGRRAPLASTNFSNPESKTWPMVGRFRVDVESFESLVLPELQIKEDTDLFVIDEIGKMELYSPPFFPAVLKILGSGVPVLATIPIPKSGRDIPAVARIRNHQNATLYTLTTSNRDTKKERISSQLLNALQKP